MRKNRNKKFDNFGDLILSRKRRSQADIGELFADLGNNGRPTYKQSIGVFVPVGGGFNPTITNPQNGDTLIDLSGNGEYTNVNLEEAVQQAVGYAETIVNISSAQILAMGSTPIELLPAAGVGKYYDINKMLFEFTYGNTVYAIDGVDPEYIIFPGAASGAVANISPDVIISPNNYYLIINNTFLDSNLQLQGNYALDQPLTMTTGNGQNFINGDGTLRIKIYHKTITFGA